jgi:predicted alpha/beta-fold hydrolase
VLIKHKIRRETWCKHEKEEFEVKDGGRLRLDWAWDNRKEKGRSEPKEGECIAMYIPGFMGISISTVPLNIQMEAMERGFKVLTMNPRGVYMPKLYSNVALS